MNLIDNNLNENHTTMTKSNLIRNMQNADKSEKHPVIYAK